MQLNQFTKLEEMFERARRSIAGGIGSSSRSLGAGFPTLFMECGEGSRIYDVDGNEYIDYWLGAGPLLLGHRPKSVIDAVKNVLDTRGSLSRRSHY